MLTTREAKLADCHFLAELCRDNSDLYDPLIPGAFEKQAKKFESQGLPDSYEVRIIENNGEPIGFVGLKKVTDALLYIVGFYIHSEYQGNSIGTKVLDKVLSCHREAGFQSAALMAHKGARWAIHFYEKNGFKMTADSLDKIKKDIPILAQYYIMDTLLMTKSLA